MTQTINIENLKNHPKNIRKSYGDLKELTASIKEKGVLQNLVVVPDPKNEGMYLVVAGDCRLRAAKKAGLTSLECVVTEMTEQEQVLTMLVENMQRNGLSIAEEAAGIQMCLEDFGMKVADVAKATGLSHSTIRSRRNIAKLDPGIVREKTGENRQITISDLNALTKVKDVDKRNEILESAKDSSNLLWMVKQAENDEIQERNYTKLSALAEEAGITFTEDVSSSDLYGNKWEAVKSFNLLEDTPDALFDEDESPDTDGMLYVVHYKTFKVIRKARKEKREPTERELRERAIRKTRRGIKALWKQMLDEMRTFARSLMDGQIPEADDLTDIPEMLWQVIVRTEAYASREAILSLLSGKAAYELSADEHTLYNEQIKAMPLYQQMMAIALKGCAGIDLATYDGKYNVYGAETATVLVSALESFGFSFGEDEYYQVLDGSHELYLKEEPAETTAPELDSDDVSVTSDLSDVEIDEGSLSEDISETTQPLDELDIDGFVPIESDEAAFETARELFGEDSEDATLSSDDGEEDDYPTVYSTDDPTVYSDGMSDLPDVSDDTEDAVLAA